MSTKYLWLLGLVAKKQVKKAICQDSKMKIILFLIKMLIFMKFFENYCKFKHRFRFATYYFILIRIKPLRYWCMLTNLQWANALSRNWFLGSVDNQPPWTEWYMFGASVLWFLVEYSCVVLQTLVLFSCWFVAASKVDSEVAEANIQMNCDVFLTSQ